MKLLFVLLGLTVLSCSINPPVDARRSGADSILAEMKSACGGEAWDRVRGWHETGVVDVPGRGRVSNEVWHDMRSLKTAMINHVDGKVVRHTGFDGSAYWQMTPAGKVEISQDPTMLRRHRRDAYLSSAGWFFPDRFPATIVSTGAHTVDGQVLDVLRITPQDADTFDLWVDRKTRHVSRIVAGNEYAKLTDYRMFEGVCSATTGRQGSVDPTNDIVLHVQTIQTSEPISPERFSPPTNSES